jgi:hypothetical protein
MISSSHDPTCKWEREDFEKHRVPDWMLEVLKLNPGYNGWAPGMDYMKDVGGRGWDSAGEFQAWADDEWVDDLNVIADFYFQVVTDDCDDCEGCLKGKPCGRTKEEPRVELLLWKLHPRKGASKGVIYRKVEEKDLPGICRTLAEAARQNAVRFEKIVEEARPPTERIGRTRDEEDSSRHNREGR